MAGPDAGLGRASEHPTRSSDRAAGHPQLLQLGGQHGQSGQARSLAKERGFTGLALTDDSSVGGAVDLCHGGDEVGLNTVIGTTLPVLMARPGKQVVLP